MGESAHRDVGGEVEIAGCMGGGGGESTSNSSDDVDDLDLSRDLERVLDLDLDIEDRDRDKLSQTDVARIFNELLLFVGLRLLICSLTC